MPECVLISVPHTGTLLTVGIFTACGFRDSNLVPAKREENTIYHGHAQKGTQIHAALQLARHMPLVIPLRHPFRVEESWKRRKKEVAEMIEAFDAMQDRFFPLDPYVVPVDSECRDSALVAMSAGFGIEFKTEWPLVNVKKKTHDIALDDLDPSAAVIDLAKRMDPLLSRFYP